MQLTPVRGHEGYSLVQSQRGRLANAGSPNRSSSFRRACRRGAQVLTGLVVLVIGASGIHYAMLTPQERAAIRERREARRLAADRAAVEEAKRDEQQRIADARAQAEQARLDEQKRIAERSAPLYMVGSREQHQAWRQDRALVIVRTATLICQKLPGCTPDPVDPNSAEVQWHVDQIEQSQPDAWKYFTGR